MAFVVVGVAAAARGDPEEQFTAADQARAKAMLLRRADFGPNVKASSPGDDVNFYCKALDESDLVLTGKAESPDFDRKSNRPTLLSAGSAAYVYKTAAHAAESWRRSTSSEGVRCLVAGFRHVAKEEGGIVVSFEKTAFPRLAPRSFAFRVRLKFGETPMILDGVVFLNGRAQAGPIFVGIPFAYPRVEQLRLARIVARRTAEAMGGG